MSKIIDCVSFNGEADLLEIRLNVLDDYVDQFIIVEAPVTFSGKPKPLYYEEQKERFKKWHKKIKYFDTEPSVYEEKYMVLANGSPNTRGAVHWKTEFCQKESIKDALTHLNDDDIVFIGDVDEIWSPLMAKHSISLGMLEEPRKLKLMVYSYWLNNRSSEEFWGTLVARYQWIKDECLNHLRTQAKKTKEISGFHFTSMGGYEEVKRKLSDSYTAESYWNPYVAANLEKNIETSHDFLGRDFTYRIDESYWPQWLKVHRDDYKHLLK